MISASSAFKTANAALAKKPIYVIEIEGYDRAFTTAAGLGSFPGLPANPIIQFADRITDFGGFTGFPGDVTLANATPAGNILFAFLYHGDGGTSVSISDTASNTWTLLFSNSTVSIWWATAVAATAGNVVTFVTGATRGNSEFYVCEVLSAYSGFAFGHASGGPGGTIATVTVGSNTITVPNIFPLSTWTLFGVALAPAATPSMGINLGFLVGGYSITRGQFIVGGAASQLVIGGQTTAYDWIVDIQDLKTTVNDLDGGCDLADLIFNIQDTGEAITGDFPNFTFEGKQCVLLAGFVGMTLDQYLPVSTGVIDTVASANGNAEYQFTVPSKNSKKLSAIIYTTGDDGFSVDSSHPRTVSGNPIDIYVSALQQAGVPLSDIDTAKLYFYRDTIYSGAKLVFSLTSAPAADDFIKNELMKPIGAYMRETNLGVMTANFFYPALSGNGSFTPPAVPAANEDENTAADVPIAGEADLVNSATFRFDDSGSGSSGFLAESTQQYGPSITKYGLVGSQIVESKGMRSAFQGFFWAQIIARLIFLRYGLKNLVLDAVPFLWSEMLTEEGDINALTMANVPNRAGGTMGITNMTFEVLDRNLRLMEGIVELKLLAIDLTKFKQYLITPNAEPDFTADTLTNQQKYLYQSDAAGKYSDGSTANTVC